MHWILMLVLCASLAAETLDQVFQRVTDWADVTIVAPDGTFLGTLEPDEFAPLSVFNHFGKHGSEFEAQSVKNTFGKYGGEFGQYSPINNFCTNPPLLCVKGVAVAYITSNQYSPKEPTMTLGQVLALPDQYQP